MWQKCIMTVMKVIISRAQHIVKPRRMNKGPDHLSRLEHGEEPTSLEDTLSDAHLLAIRKIDDHFT
jgi:hypothetical protein